MTKEQQLAERIIAAVGGMDNIDSVMNCMTRVRIKVLDENKVDDQELRHIDGVMGVIHENAFKLWLDLVQSIKWLIIWRN